MFLYIAVSADTPANACGWPASTLLKSAARNAKEVWFQKLSSNMQRDEQEHYMRILNEIREEAFDLLELPDIY